MGAIEHYMPGRDIQRQVEMYALPDGIYLYTVSGHCVFPVVTSNGSLLSTCVSILVEKLPSRELDFGQEGLFEKDGGRWYVVKMLASDDWHEVNQKFKAGFDALCEVRNGNR